MTRSACHVAEEQERDDIADFGFVLDANDTTDETHDVHNESYLEERGVPHVGVPPG